MMSSNHARPARFLVLFALVLLHGVGFARAAENDPRNSAPRSLVITYHTLPANRIALRKAMLDGGLEQFAGYKRQGVLTDYHVYFNRYVDSDNWDMLALVTLAPGDGTGRWKKIEAEHPAGLTEDALRLTTAINTTPSDLLRTNSRPEKDGKPPVYLIVPYDYLVSLAEYLKYVDGYVLPQLDGWMGAGILSRYGLYLSRYAAGRPWSALLVFEYADEEALGSRDVVMASVRAQLKNNPAWKAISDNKQSVRSEKQPVVADQLTAD
jgi:hypothetical protein